MKVSVTGHCVLDVTAWRQKNSMTLHLVNLTNPINRMSRSELVINYRRGIYSICLRVDDNGIFGSISGNDV